MRANTSTGAPMRLIETNQSKSEEIRFILKMTAYVVYGLFIIIDGLRNPLSYYTKVLTIPYFVGGLALARSIDEALTHHYDLHATLFTLGLLTLAALA